MRPVIGSDRRRIQGAGSPQVASNPTARVVAIIDYLAAHPDESFGATALARILDMNKSTCLAVLTTLTGYGYLIQHQSRRDYRLGPGLIGAGRSALSRFHDLSGAHPALAACAAELGMAITASTVADDQIVVVDVVGPSDPFGGVQRVGVRVPFEPPYGAAFVAWADPAMWARWVGSADPALTAQQTENVRAAVRAARQLGFLVLLDLAPEHEMREFQHAMRYRDRQLSADNFKRLGAERLVEGNCFCHEIDPSAEYLVGHIQTPLLGPPLQVPLILDAVALGRSMTGSEVLAAGRALIETARNISSSSESS